MTVIDFKLSLIKLTLKFLPAHEIKALANQQQRVSM